MKKILCVSNDGSGAPIAANLRDEGNEVRFYVKKPEERDVYAGILENEKTFEPALKWCDFVVFLENKLDDIWEKCIKEKPCFGGSTAGMKLEKDRELAHDLMKSLGIKVPESLIFKDIAEVEAHLKEHKAIHVVKPIGPQTDSDDVFLSEYPDGRDAIALMHRMESQGKKVDYIEVQEKIIGIEAGTDGYFDGTRFAPGIIVSFQHKPFAAGNNGEGVGFLTGEMGTLSKNVDENSPFFKRTLAKMAPYLKKINYRGEIDCGFICNEKGDYFIEHTTRLGYPSCVIQLETQLSPNGELYYNVATGNAIENEYSKKWSMGVVVTSPGFPDKEDADRRSTGLPIFGYEENKKHCRLFEAALVKGKYEISANGCGYPLVVTGQGDTIASCKRNTYWTLHPANPKRVFVPKAWYRDDIGDRVANNEDEIIDLDILTREEWDAT